jgi:3-keto-5-aminohexanoate cleavage enzyme
VTRTTENPAPAQTGGKPLMVEVRANENRLRTTDEFVPYTVQQVVQDAVECWEAGAAIYHFHARTPEGGAAHDPGFYREAMAEISARTDLVVHPTTGFTDESDSAARVQPIRDLKADPAVRLEIAALAFGVTNLDHWDDRCRDFVPGDLVYLNSRAVISSILDVYDELALPTISVCWELSHIRTALRYRTAGRSDHRLWQLALSGGDLAATGAPDIDTLSAMVRALPAGEEWMVWCHGGDVSRLAAHAIAMDAHVGIGLGDHDYAPGARTNVELLQHVTALASLLGRPLATPTQARQMLGLANPSDSV